MLTFAQFIIEDTHTYAKYDLTKLKSVREAQKEDPGR